MHGAGVQLNSFPFGFSMMETDSPLQVVLLGHVAMLPPTCVRSALRAGTDINSAGSIAICSVCF